MQLLGSTVILALASLGLASPIRSSKSNVQGAAYFITNDPNGNFVVSADLLSNGTVAFQRATSASGKGLHGVTDPIGADGLFSQGSVQVAGDLLATVNPGSNTVALFGIDKNDPSSISMIGRPVSSGGEFPMSVAFNKKGNALCALNGGKTAGVQCFSISRSGLSPLNNTVRALPLNQTTPPAGPPGTTSQIAFSEDGNQLIASVKGIPPTPGYLAVWDVQGASLSQNFTAVAPPTGGALPFSMTPIAGKNAFLVTDPALGVDIFDLSAGARAGNGSTSSTVEIPGQGATCWSEFSSKTGNFYVSDIGTSIISEISVGDGLNGTLVKQYPQGNGSSTIDMSIATLGGQDFLYVLAASKTSINVLSLNAPGNASSVGSFQFGHFNSSKLNIDGNNVQGMAVYVKSRKRWWS